MQSGAREEDCIDLSLVEFAQARIQVASKLRNAQVGTIVSYLRLAAETARSEECALRQRLQRDGRAGDQRVARVFALRDAGEFQSIRQRAGHILEAVNA